MNATAITAILMALVSVALAGAALATMAKFKARSKRKFREIESHLDSTIVELRRARGALAETEAALAMAGQSARNSGIAFRSQYGEDSYLWWLFDRQTSGIYVEAGALDGVHLSCTFALERVGWTGLLVEPVKAQAEACRESRPNSHVIHGALVAPGGPETIEIASVSGSSHEALSALSYVPGVADEDNARSASISGRGYDITVEHAPAITLDEALEQSGVGRPDVIVLDVEGAELQALDGLSLDAVKPRVLLIEANSGNKDHLFSCNDRMLAEIRKRVEPAGYILADQQVINAVFIRKDEPGLLKRAAELKGW